MRPRTGLGWSIGRVLVAPILTAVPGIVVEIVDAVYRAKDLLLTPELHSVSAGSAIATIATLAYMGYVLWKYVRPHARERRRGYRIGAVVAVVVANGAMILLALFALLAVNFRLFGASYTGVSSVSPDGKRVAYLYEQGFFCRYEIHTRARGSVVLRKLTSWDVKCGDRVKLPTLQWGVGPVDVIMVDAAE